MSKGIRSAAALTVLLCSMMLPAYACISSSHSMSMEEMACCKRMAGVCDMGSAQHPCCQKIARAPQPVAVSARAVDLRPATTLAILTVPHYLLPQDDFAFDQARRPNLSPSPPGHISVLRV